MLGSRRLGRAAWIGPTAAMTDNREVRGTGGQDAQALGGGEARKEGLDRDRGRYDQRGGRAAAQKGHEPQHRFPA